MTDPNYYQTLGVSPQCSEEEIEAAYRRLLAQCFSDEGAYRPGAQNAVEALNRAYVVLTNPEKRKQYDDGAFWGKKLTRAGDPANIQQPKAGTGIPEWLKETEEFAEASPAAGDAEISEWMAELIREAENRKKATGDQHTIRVFLFISLLVLMTITLLVTLMVLSQGKL